MFNNKYQLHFENNRWLLTTRNEKDMLFKLEIKFAFHGENVHADTVSDWNEYRFYVVDDGDRVEVTSHQDWEERFTALEENEGADAASDWAQEGTVISAESGDDGYQWWKIRNQMVKHWECMIELGLFTPAITI